MSDEYDIVRGDSSSNTSTTGSFENVNASGVADPPVEEKATNGDVTDEKSTDGERDEAGETPEWAKSDDMSDEYDIVRGDSSPNTSTTGSFENVNASGVADPPVEEKATNGDVTDEKSTDGERDEAGETPEWAKSDDELLAGSAHTRSAIKNLIRFSAAMFVLPLLTMFTTYHYVFRDYFDLPPDQAMLYAGLCGIVVELLAGSAHTRSAIKNLIRFSAAMFVLPLLTMFTTYHYVFRDYFDLPPDQAMLYAGLCGIVVVILIVVAFVYVAYREEQIDVEKLLLRKTE
ncbi:VMA21-like domain protein [Cooperia oncophora]